jgi:hypothetical protein
VGEVYPAHGLLVKKDIFRVSAETEHIERNNYREVDRIYMYYLRLARITNGNAVYI